MRWTPAVTGGAGRAGAAVAVHVPAGAAAGAGHSGRSARAEGNRRYLAEDKSADYLFTAVKDNQPGRISRDRARTCPATSAGQVVPRVQMTLASRWVTPIQMDRLVADTSTSIASR